MADNNGTVPTEAGQPASVDPAGQQAGAPDPFDMSNWSTQPAQSPATTDNTQAPPATETKQEPHAPPAPPAKTETSDDLVDADEYLKTQLGFDNWENAKKEVERLKAQEQQQTQNGKVGKDAIKKLIDEQGDKIYSYLETGKKLAALQTLEPNTAENAARILKADLQLKNPQLSAEDVDFQYNRLYRTPAKPTQGEDETEGEFAARNSQWEQQVKEVERAMIIDAKLAKPNLLKHTNELDLQDIPIVPTPEVTEPTAEEMQKAKEQHEGFIREISKGIKELKGAEVEYKDEEVTIPLKYEVSPEERQKVQTIAESLTTSWDYFFDRWADKDGNVVFGKMMQDIHQLEFGGNALKKLVKEGITQRLDHQFKKNSNISVDGSGAGPIVPGAELDPMAELQAAAWK